MSNGIPDFKGRLVPTSWSTVTLTPDIESNLARAALKNCKSCSSKGWYGERDWAQLCHCVSRKESAAPVHAAKGRRPMKKPCDENCKKDNPLHICKGCGSCLYAAGFTQVKDDMYPLFKCKECGQVNFWD